MTAAIAIPATTTPAASALANGAAPSKSMPGESTQHANDDFGTALASLLGNAATPQSHAAPHTPKTKPTTVAAAATNADADPNTAATTAQALIVTPSQQTQTGAASEQPKAAEQINALAAQSSALQILQAAAGETEPAADAKTDETAPASPQNTTATAAPAAAFAALVANTNKADRAQTAAQPDTNAKPQAKPAANAKVTPSTANAAQPAADGKPGDTTTDAKATVAHAAAAAAEQSQPNANSNAQTGAAKADPNIAQVQAAAQVTIALHTSSTDATTTQAPASATPPAIPLDAVAVHMARKFESGESKFEIRLDPVELGKLDISMTVTDDGRVQAVVRAERPETLDMLQRDARVLENQLRQSGLNVDSGSLNFSLGGGNNNQRSAFAGAIQNFNSNADTAEAQTASTATSTSILSVRDGVDIRI